MEKLDNIYDKAMKAGNKLEIRITAKALEMSQAEEAVKSAAADMERAAIEGNEAAYSQAKSKRNEAENRLEILRIREKNNVEKTNWIEEATPILKELENDSVSEIRKMCSEFLDKYSDIIDLINRIDEYSMRYNKVQEYFKSHVLRSNEYNIKYMAQILPVSVILEFKRKFTFQFDTIKKAIGK